MIGFWQDLRSGLRSLRKGLLVSVLAALSLALAIGGNTTVFGFVNALIFRPLPYPEADRLVLLGERETSSPVTLTASVANLIDWNDRNRTFSDIVGFRPLPMSLGAGDRPEPLTVGQVSPGMFELLGTTPIRGRTFQRDDGLVGAEKTTLLGFPFWKQRYPDGLDPAGTTIVLNREPYTVVGVLPDGFEFFNPQVEVWVPMTMELGAVSRDSRDAIGVGRLLPDVTMDQAREDLESIHRQLEKEYPQTNRGFVVDALNLQYDVPDRNGRLMLALLQGAVVFVLLIACLNIANLLLARAQERRREIALRIAIGAGRLRIVRQLMTESLALAAIGGVLGAGLGVLGLRLLARSFATLVPSYWVPGVDASVMLVTAGLTAAAGLLFGISPALMSLKVNLAESVKESGRGSTVSRRWASRALVVAEISLSVILLAGGSALVQSLLSVRSADPGFQAQNLLTASFSVTKDGSQDQNLLIERLVRRAASVPGVEQATVTSVLPQSTFVSSNAFALEGHVVGEEEALPRAITIQVGPEYLDTLEFSLLQGRFINRADRQDVARVAVISQSIATRFFGDGEAVGTSITVLDEPRRIVGIVEDIKQSLLNQGTGTEGAIYVPIAQSEAQAPFLLIRCAVDPTSIAGTVRNELLDADPSVAVGQIRSLEELTAQVFVGVNAFNVILTGFGVLALFLAMIGTYGVLAYNVAQRSQEFGVRLAMGAAPLDIVRMVTKQGVLLAILGILIALPGVYGVIRLVNSLLIYAQPVHTSTIVIVFVMLFLASVLASWLPARRAGLLDPVSVLRGE